MNELSPAERHDLLGRISTAVVQAVKKAAGKGPEHVKSYFLDDMLVVVTKGGMSVVERTMLEGGQSESVREFRRVLDAQMEPELRQLIVDMTGHRVLGYQSQVMFDPDRVIAIFVLDEALGAESVEGEEPSKLG